MEIASTPASVDNETPARNGAEDAFTLVGATLASAGLLMNVATLSVIFAVRMKVRWLRPLLGSLCVSDALLSVATLVLLGFHYHDKSAAHAAHANTALHRTEFCVNEIFGYVWNASTNANLLTLVVMAAQLFASVKWPLRSGPCLSTAATASALTLIWLVSAAMSFTPALLISIQTEHERTKLWRTKAHTLFCYQMVLYMQQNDGGAYRYPFGQESQERALLILGLLVTVLVLIALLATYAYVYYVVRAKRGRFSSSQSPGSSTRPALREERRLVIFASLTTAVFLLCYLPLFSFHFASNFYGLYRDGRVFALLTTFVAVTPVADPLLYSFRLEEIRGGFVRLITRCKSMSVRCHYKDFRVRLGPRSVAKRGLAARSEGEGLKGRGVDRCNTTEPQSATDALIAYDREVAVANV